MLKELVGYGSTDKAVYPITSTGAVFDSNSTSLDNIIADLYAKIKDAGGSSSGGSGSGSGSDGKGEKGDKGDPGETYDYVPCFIYFHPEDNAVPKKPVGGSYDFTTNTLTPPSGWSISYSDMNKPIYMSIGMACSKPGSTIEWSSPFIAFSDSTGGGSDLPYDPVPESNYKTLFIYKHSYTQPDMPVGGSYDFSTQRIVLPDGGWQLTKDNLENPVYMSIGFCSKDKTDIEWSYPVIVADKDGLGPGKTPANDILTKTFVVVAYKKDTSSEGPATPSSSNGSVDFTTSPYTVTPPNGWSLDRTMAVNDNVWCTIKVFHQTSKNDYDNSSTPWSKPVKANLANIDLTADQMQLIADHIEVDSNEIETAFGTWIAQGSNIQMIADKIAETADIYTVTAGQYIVNADFIENVANKVISVANFKQDVIQDASGKAVVQITADKDGLYSAIAKNIVQEAIQDKDNKGGIIYLVAKDVTNNITAEILTGTDENGKGFVKAIANNIDFNSNSFKSIVANAAEGKVTAIMHDDNTIALINKAASDTASSLIVGDQFINLIAPKVDVSGKLSSKDLTINGGKSYFSKDGDGYVANESFKWDQNGNIKINNDATQFNIDGSGQVANGNVSWDPNGNLILKGSIQADYLKYTVKVLYPTTDNNTFTLDPIKDRCSIYIVAYDYDNNSTTIINSTKLILSDNVEQGITFKIGLICNGNSLQVWSSLLSVPLTSKSNSYIMGEGYKSTSTTDVSDFVSSKIELGFNTIYEFTYLGYNVWALNGKCRAYE